MANESKGIAYVTVACKLPNGLWLQLHRAQRITVPVLGGGTRDETQFMREGNRYRVYGNSHPQNKAPMCEIVAGFALTHNIPKDFWDKWLDQNSESEIVKKSIIFGYAGRENIDAASKDHEKVKSGFERMDPTNLPSVVRKVETYAQGQQQPPR